MERVLLIGSGARENAMADAIVKSKKCKLYSCQAYSNYGITRISEKVLNTEKDNDKIIEFCKENEIDFCIVGPEAALERGVVDALESAGFPCAAPTKAAARIETDKFYARKLLDKYKINGQIKYLKTSDLDEALNFCESLEYKVAVKPIGLTAGKGVKVWGDHLKNKEEVKEYIQEILDKKMDNNSSVIIEELLVGQEFTIHFFADGKNAFETLPVQDHKRAFEKDKGPNTGGMGAYSVKEGLPFLTKEDYAYCTDIGKKVIEALANDGNPFKGILYGQFILTKNGPKIIEFNSRFGDPEAMNTLTLLDSDYFEICKKIIVGTLDKESIKFKDVASLTCYVVPKGYGEKPVANQEVVIDEESVTKCGGKVFYGSCNFVGIIDGKVHVTTTTSRTLAIVKTGEDLEKLHEEITKILEKVEGNIFYRKDIGSKESIKAKVEMIKRLR